MHLASCVMISFLSFALQLDTPRSEKTRSTTHLINARKHGKKIS